MPDNTFVANRSAPPLAVSEDERRRLETWTRSRVIPQRDVQRAKVILLAAEGVPNHEIAARTGCSQPTVRLWQSRFSERGLAGLQEREGRGHPFTYTEDDVARIIATTLKGPPAGSTHWSTRDHGRPPWDERQHGAEDLAGASTPAPPREHFQVQQ